MLEPHDIFGDATRLRYLHAQTMVTRYSTLTALQRRVSWTRTLTGRFGGFDLFNAMVGLNSVPYGIQRGMLHFGDMTGSAYNISCVRCLAALGSLKRAARVCGCGPLHSMAVPHLYTRHLPLLRIHITRTDDSFLLRDGCNRLGFSAHGLQAWTLFLLRAGAVIVCFRAGLCGSPQDGSASWRQHALAACGRRALRGVLVSRRKSLFLSITILGVFRPSLLYTLNACRHTSPPVMVAGRWARSAFLRAQH